MSLQFTDRLGEAVGDADIAWIAYDTPVDEDDRADVEYVLARARDLVAASDPEAVILVSSQLPVGSTRLLEQASGSGRTFAYSPENLRLGDAVAAFTEPDRIVVGIRPDADRERIEELLGAFSDEIEWMSVESAELVKHGMNAFLALSIAFANELAGIAEHVGADASEVERGLKTERRIGARAYLRAGARVRRRHARARRRLPDRDRRARAARRHNSCGRYARATTSTSSGRGERSSRS